MDRKSQGNLIRFKNMLQNYVDYLFIDYTDDYLLINYKMRGDRNVPGVVLINYAFMNRNMHQCFKELNHFAYAVRTFLPDIRLKYTIDTGSITMEFMDGKKRKEIRFSSPLTTEIINFLKNKAKNIVRPSRARIYMRDGFVMFIQTTDRIRKNGKYSTVNVMLFNMEESLLDGYEREENGKYTVVPLEVVGRIIFKHGGIDYMKTFEEEDR